MKRSFFTVFLLFFSCYINADEFLSNFANGNNSWCNRSYNAFGEKVYGKLQVVKQGIKGNICGLELPIILPNKNEFVLQLQDSLFAYESLEFSFFIPKKLPKGTIITIFSKDWDSEWRQIRITSFYKSSGKCKIVIPLSGDKATKVWNSKGGQRPWHSLIAGQLKEIGFCIESDTGIKTTYNDKIYLLGVKLINKSALNKQKVTIKQAIKNPICITKTPCRGKVCEFSFEYHLPFKDPFDYKNLQVKATITNPFGKRREVRGFYFEDFTYDGQVDSQKMYPYGYPEFRIRFNPRYAGKYLVDISLIDGNCNFTLPRQTVHVKDDDNFRGFIRVNKHDKRYLCYDDDTPFWGIGLNVRSPFDARYINICPYSSWKDEGLPLYERLFPKYKKNGINVVEVWMSSWWLALEWIDNAPGNHGIGYMNQYRAWMLDKIIQWAEENDIYLILVFNNHGKFGMRFDTEWKFNPFNKACGGYLDSCEQYFSDVRAKEAFKKFANYVIARWSSSSHILTWKLFTEIDLIGKHDKFHHSSAMTSWHKEMATYVKSIDPNKHLITTHWMYNYNNINDKVANLSELDLLTADAYYPANQGTKGMMKMLQGTVKLANRKQRPIIITEYGGSPYADSMGNLLKQAHLGLWDGFVNGSPVTPMFWWFSLVDENNLYSNYLALAKFTKGEENRIGMQTYTKEPSWLKPFGVRELRGENKRFFWVFNSSYYYSALENVSPNEISGYKLRVIDLNAGNWQIEYWNCHTGEIIKKEELHLKRSKDTYLNVPKFTRDIAVKIKRK